jgi:predicted Zn-dependent peptidase
MNTQPSSASSHRPAAVQRFTLPNGLRVWIEPRPQTEAVTVLAVLRAGSRYETPDNNGISHFVEHMVFDGTEKWPTEEEVMDVITHRGGEWNGWTGEETTTYFVQLAQRHVEVAFDWLSQVVFHPIFPPDKVDKERDIIFQEKMGRYGWLINTLDRLGLGYELDRDVRRAIFPGSTLGLRIIGEDASLDRITRPALLAYYRAHYIPANSVLIVVGKVSVEDAYALVQKYFGAVTSTSPLPSAPSTPPLPAHGPHLVTVRGPLPTDQSALMVGMRTIGLAHPDRWALAVLAEILQEDLLKEIRFRRGLVYDLHAFTDYFVDTGHLGLITEFDSPKRAEIQRVIEQYFDKVRRGEITAEQVHHAQAALKGQWALEMEDSTDRAAWLAQWAFEADGSAILDYDAAIDSVQPADVQRMVETYFTPERRYVGLHHPAVTVPHGARLLGLAAGVSALVWLARRLWRLR